MKKFHHLAVAVALALGAPSPALAAPSASGLATAGFTIAGPGATTLGTVEAQDIYVDDSGNSDACTTVSNVGKSSVRLSVTGNGSGFIDVAIGDTAALCREQVELVTLTCQGTGTSTCSVQWRVDRD